MLTHLLPSQLPKKIKVDCDHQKACITTTNKTSAPIWNPIDSIRKIIHDIQQKSSSSSSTTNGGAPSSRFVTRMIPIQATCFASLEEIKQTAEFLLEKYLFPLADKNDKEKKVITFEIAIKRRNCSNVTRDEIINCIASIINNFEKSANNKDGTTKETKPLSCTVTNEKIVTEKNESKEKESVSGSYFRVDLKNPNYTIQVEICRTLCGMSVITNCRQYKKFNLLEIREEAEEEAAEEK